MRNLRTPIAVYGASGYQAGLVLAELSRRALPAVLTGRDPARLAVAARAAGLPGAERRTATAADHDALVTAFAGCSVVINCAGPFGRTGTAVAGAAIAAGCHYVDTAGEQLPVKALFDDLTGAAERTGVTVVPATNDGALPTDLLAPLVADRVGTVAEIAISHFLSGGGGPSRGSLRSVADAVDTFASGGLDFRAGQWLPGSPARSSVVLPGAAEATPVVRFPLVEVVTVPRHVVAGRVVGLVEAAVGDRIATPLAPAQIDVLPVGPDPASRLDQRFTYLVDAIGTDGRTARGVVRGTDTYGATAVIAVEAARRLAVDGARAGVLAPAQAFDPVDLLAFLSRQGISADSEAGVVA